MRRSISSATALTLTKLDTQMHYDGIYTIRHYAREQKHIVPDFPVAIFELPVGVQREQCWHEHNSIELVLITAGAGRHVIDGHSAAIRKGDVLVIYPGFSHGYENCGTLALVNLMYDSSRLPFPILDAEKIPLFRSLFPENLADIPCKPSPEPLLHFNNDEDMEEVLREIRSLNKELSTPLTGNLLFCTVSLLHILLSILNLTNARQQIPAESHPYTIAKILEYINKNYTKRIPLEVLVRMSRLSPRVFQYKFKQLTGLSVTQYILARRLNRAKDLLTANAERPIQNVAFDCGFQDLSYFTLQFRRHNGITPKQYRLDAKKDSDKSSKI